MQTALRGRSPHQVLDRSEEARATQAFYNRGTMCLKPLVQYNLNSFSVRNDLILLWIEYDHWYFFLCLGPGCGLKIYGQFRTIAHAQAKLVKNIRSLGKGKPQKIGKTHRWPVRQLFLPFGLLGERYVVVSVLPWERHLVGPNILKGISNRVRHYHLFKVLQKKKRPDEN